MIEFYATGVMGGSGGGSTTLLGVAVEPQDYRGMIQGAIKEVDETAKIVDPRAFIGVYLMQSILQYYGGRLALYWIASWACTYIVVGALI